MKMISLFTAGAMSCLLTAQAFPAGLSKVQAEEQAATIDADTRQVQQALKDAGFEPGPIDGILGSRTREALRNFQTANNLQATGEVNQDTLAALKLPSEEEGIGAMGGREEKKGEERPGATGTRDDGKSREQPADVKPGSETKSTAP